LVCEAILCCDEKNYEKAIAFFKHAIEIDPQKPNAYMLLGNLMLSEKMYKEAINLYEKASQYSKDKSKPYLFLGNTYGLLKDECMAIEYYRKAIRIAPEDKEITLIYIEVLGDYITKKAESR
jgi:tetratricopeptide (TPR) repeat protein